jgi:adenylylsulfate kinase-like enzyme
VHLEAPIEVCRARDVDGHYKLADSGEFGNFPGVTAPYDPPTHTDLVLHTDQLSIDECVDRIMQLLGDKRVFLV